MPEQCSLLEEWRDIPGWEGFYQASNVGRVRSLTRHDGRRTVRGQLLRSHPIDGAVLLGGCDKTTPGLLISNVPSSGYSPSLATICVS